jgi:integrase
MEHVQCYPSALRLFYQTTLGRVGHLDGIPCPKEPKRLPVVLSPEEVAQFLAACRDSRRV